MTDTNSQDRFFYLMMFLIAFAILILRRPDIVTNAQPWAEDGNIWFKGVYEHGIFSLLKPQDGYYQTLSRTIWALALNFGLRHMALAATLMAVTLRAAFATFLLSPRFSRCDMSFRLCAYFYLLLMPNLAEGYVSANTVHWHMTMYLLATLIADDPKTLLWKAHDHAVLLLSGFAGPFIIFMAPCLALKRIRERGGILKAIRGMNAYDAAFALIVLIQAAAVLITAPAARSKAPLGFSVPLLVKILSFRIVAGSFLPDSVLLNGQAPNVIWGWLGVALLLVMLWRFFAETKSTAGAMILMFAALMLAFGFMRPMIHLSQPQLPFLLLPDAGGRYFFIPNFAFGLLVFWYVDKLGARLGRTVRSVAVLLIFILLAANFRIEPLPDVGYRQAIERFAAAPAGATMTIPLAPPGWSMTLTKR
ncbi:MAG: hypothetical protein IJ233_10000 [Pyramidobacter sp.]|nr:hypothetical protein [Pyramidobacter sp.]